MKLATASMICLTMVLYSPFSPQRDTSQREPVDFIENLVEVEGIGVPPEQYDSNSSRAYVMAREAAIVVADRNLAKVLQSVYVDARTRVSDYSAASTINSELQRTKVSGGLVTHETSHEEYMKTKVVGVTVRYPLRGGVLPILIGAIGQEIRKREESLSSFQPPVAALTPAQIPKLAYDGMIVRVPASFRPSLDPKIFTPKGELIYGARTVAMDVLVSRGTAQFTNSESKASAVLESIGCRNILSVSGSLNTDSDAELSSKIPPRCRRRIRRPIFWRRHESFFW